MRGVSAAHNNSSGPVTHGMVNHGSGSSLNAQIHNSLKNRNVRLPKLYDFFLSNIFTFFNNILDSNPIFFSRKSVLHYMILYLKNDGPILNEVVNFPTNLFSDVLLQFWTKNSLGKLNATSRDIVSKQR